LASNTNHLPNFGHTLSRGCVESSEHLIEPTTRRAQDQETSWVIADIAEGMAPTARSEKEPPGADTARGRFAFKFEEQFSIQNVKRFG
jgi:hypothetical protein